MACPGLTAAYGQPTAPAPGCTDSWIRRIGSAVPGLMVLHTSLDLRTAPAQGCTNSLVRRVGSAEGITAACGQPGGLWPLVACPPSAPAVKLLRASFVKTKRVGSAGNQRGKALRAGTRRGRAHSPWICVLHQPSGCSDSPEGRARSAEGLIALVACPGLTAACGMPLHARMHTEL